MALNIHIRIVNCL